MSRSSQSLGKFIERFAQRVAIRYPNSYADKEDYIQAGHLKLAEIRRDEREKRDFKAYSITAIARAMRGLALESMGSIYAPQKIKRLAHKIGSLSVSGKTEREICNELNISSIILMSLKSLVSTRSFDQLFNQPAYNPEPFSMIDDLLAFCNFTKEDKVFLRAQLDGDMDNLGLTRKQKWIRVKILRSKIMRSGYGI